MIIADLNHLEIIVEEVTVIGGESTSPTYQLLALADAASAAEAIGSITKTLTATQTGSVAGLFSKSLSVSSSFAAN